MSDKPKTKDWEKELRNRWHLWNGKIGGGGFVTCHNEVVEFIRSTIAEAVEEERERIVELITQAYEKANKEGVGSNSNYERHQGFKSGLLVAKNIINSLNQEEK